MFKLAKSLIRQNKGITIALVTLYMLTTVVITLTSMVPQTVRASVEDFEETCSMADIYLVTSPADSTLLNDLREIDGVAEAYASNCWEYPVRLPDGKLILMSFLSLPDDNAQARYFYDSDGNEEIAVSIDEGLAVNVRFTKFNDLEAGDTITVYTPLGEKQVQVTKTVTTPESILAIRDLLSWYEDESYGYFYLSDATYQELFGAEGTSSYWIIQLEDSADAREVANEASRILGPHVSYYVENISEETGQYQTIRENLNMLESVCTNLPTMILAVVLAFSILFVSQVVFRSRALVGLLKALGYKNAQITGIFLLYVMIPVIAGAALGIGVGFAASLGMVGLYVDQFSLPHMVLSCDVSSLALQVAVVLVLAACACLFACLSINKVDPAEAYGGKREVAHKPSALARILPVSPFAKVGIELATHNKVRIVNCALCMIAALCLVASGIFLTFSLHTSVSSTFNERLLYDAMVDLSVSSTTSEDVADLPEVAQAERIVRTFATISVGKDDADDDGTSETIQINAIEVGSALVQPHSADGEAIPVGNSGIIVDEGLANRLELSVGQTVYVGGNAVKVTGIARECVNPISYVSLEQAETWGLVGAEGVLVNVNDDVTENQFRDAVYEVAPDAYVVFLESQEINMDAAMQSIEVSIMFIVLLSIVIGLVIVYNMTELSIAERKREYATLLVLGTGNARLTAITLIESLAELIIAVVLGCPIAYFAASTILDGMCSVGMQFPVVDAPAAIAISVLITALYVVTATLLAQARVRKWNPITVLNSED